MGRCRLTMEDWRYALASVEGTSHAKKAFPCQDAVVCRVLQLVDGSSIFIAVMSDGAGSASRAEHGSQLTCAVMVDQIVRLYEGGGGIHDIDHDLVEAWVDKLQSEMHTCASREDLTQRDFACTLLAAVVEPSAAAFVQIGDGAIIVSPCDEPDGYAWVFWPERGEYANQTHFVTDEDAKEHVLLDVTDTSIDQVSLFTDGIQALALHYETQTAFEPFFRSLFAPLRSEPPGQSDRLSKALADLLGSARVNARTDDDKTLVIATRLCEVSPATPEEEPATGV